MKKISLIGKARYLGYILIAMQGILLILFATFFANQSYIDAWQSYPANNAAVTVYLKNVASEKQPEVESYLMNSADEQQLFLVRTDMELEANGLKIGVYGNYNQNDATFSFMNQQILYNENLETLLSSNNPDSTLGVETGSINSVGVIPYFRFYEKVVIKQLPQLINDSDTINGTYSILGLNEQNEDEFLDGLSNVSGISKKALLEKSSGSFTDRSFMRDILFIFIATQIFLNIIFFLVIAVKSLPREGKLVLLGWSQGAFANETLGKFFRMGIVYVPFLLCIGWLLSGWKQFSITLLGYQLAAVIVNILVLVVELGPAAIIILKIKSLDAIRGRIPKRPLYVFGIIAYLLISIGIVFCGSYVDQPLKQISENAKLSGYWQEVSEYQILGGISLGQDSDSLSGQSNKLNEDFYNWYSSIADEDGVYLVHTQYYSENVISGWKNNGIYTSTPEQPFWYFVVSPNYLSELGIEVSEDVIAHAKSGTRLYLLPSTLSEAERQQIEVYFKESSTRSISDGDIPTTFSKERSFEFQTYDPVSELFTWATESNSTMSEKSPIIYVATPENMTYFEAESLSVAGLDGYIKFIDEKTAERYTEADIFGQFDLTDNAPVITAVQDYIDGLQNDIWTVIFWFGFSFAVLVAILIGLLITLATIFRIANQEKINVKKFLGFNFWRLYKAPMCMLSSVIILEIAVMLMLGSKLGSLLMLVVAILQIIIFSRYMARSELKRLLIAFKGE